MVEERRDLLGMIGRPEKRRRGTHVVRDERERPAGAEADLADQCAKLLGQSTTVITLGTGRFVRIAVAPAYPARVRQTRLRQALSSRAATHSPWPEKPVPQQDGRAVRVARLSSNGGGYLPPVRDFTPEAAYRRGLTRNHIRFMLHFLASLARKARFRAQSFRNFEACGPVTSSGFRYRQDRQRNRAPDIPETSCADIECRP